MRVKKSLIMFLVLTYFFIFTNKNLVHAEELSFNFIETNNNLNKRLEVVPCGLIIGIQIDGNNKAILSQKKIKYEKEKILPAKKSGSQDLVLAAYNNFQNKTCMALTQGIGTMTYYNPVSNKFGALGHGITDLDTQKLLNVKSGNIKQATDITLVKASCGDPGEILGNITNTDKLGNIKLNNAFGIYGFLDLIKIKNNIQSKKIPIALKNEIQSGPAIILSNLENAEVKAYNAYIESIDKFNNNTSQNMTVRITDANLLNKTNGILQGMSGSPIIQGNKLIGAVTHVFVHEPAKGYGIFIENMIKQEKFI